MGTAAQRPLCNRRVFVTNQHDNTLSVVDTRRLDIGEFPEGIIAGPADGRIYITNRFANELVALDSANLEIIKHIPTGESPCAFGVFVAGGSWDRHESLPPIYRRDAVILFRRTESEPDATADDGCAATGMAEQKKSKQKKVRTM